MNNILLFPFGRQYTSVSLGYTPRSGIDGLWVGLHTVFQNGCVNLHVYQQHMLDPVVYSSQPCSKFMRSSISARFAVSPSSRFGMRSYYVVGY